MSLKEVVTELKKLRPEKVKEVARIIHDLSQTGCGVEPLHSVVPAHVVDDAVQNGWPAELFTQRIGSLPELERFAEPPLENQSSEVRNA